MSKEDPDMNSLFTLFIIGFVCGFFIAVVIASTTGWGVSSLDSLKIDKNTLAKEYVISVYPEYKNCSIEYNYNFCNDGSLNGCGKEGVNIYCDKLDNRDSLKAIGTLPITKTLLFDNITIEEIFKKKIEGMKYNG